MSDSKKQTTFQRGWVGFGRNYFHSLGSEPFRHFPADDGEKLYTWGLEEEQRNNDTYNVEMYQYCNEVPSKPKSNKKEVVDGQIAPASCSSAASYFLSGTQHNRITTVGTVHGHVMNPVLEKTKGIATTNGTFSPFVNVSPSLTTIPLPLPCVELAAGRHFCLARLEGGLAVCSWGAGHFGQLGHGTTSFGNDPSNLDANPSSTSTYQASPKVIERLLPRMVGSPIAQVAAGDWHGMALSQAGTVYAWGCNRNMQCGRKSSRANKSTGSSAPLQMIPMPVTILDSDPDRADDPPVTVAKIAAGKAHSVAITKRTHQVYCWGASHYGQCASNTGSSTRSSKYTRNTTALPRMVHLLADVHIVDVAAGDRHTLALSDKGRVFSWGAGVEGQLGIFPPIVCTPKPRLIHDLDFVAINSASNNNSNNNNSVPTIASVHAAGCSSFALSTAGHVYAWGSNDAGSLGFPIPPDHRLPYWEVGITPLPPNDARLLQVRTFDSIHNVLLPRRLDCIGHVNVEQVALGPSHSWFLGEARSSQDNNNNNNNGEAVVTVGRTLFEVHQMRKQQGLDGGGAAGGQQQQQGSGGSGGGGTLQTMGSFNATSSSFAGSASAGTTSNWGEDSLSQIDATNRPAMSPSSTMPTDDEDNTTTTDLMSASMPALEAVLDSTRITSPAAATNGNNSDSRIRTGRRHSDSAMNPPRTRHFSLSNLLKRLGGSKRHNSSNNNRASERTEESMDRSNNDKKNSDGGSKSRFRFPSSKNLK